MEPGSQTTTSGEKKYVTLETGSKLSGYTQDYLERLCRLKKVDYRIWNNGQFVIELESLLQETQTILLSHDGITFVDNGELADPVPEVVGSMLSSTLKEKNAVSNGVPETIVPPVASPAQDLPVIPASPLMAEKLETPVPFPTPVVPAPLPVAQTSVVLPESLPQSVPLITRTPIMKAPMPLPVPPRPIKINTAVENIPLPPSPSVMPASVPALEIPPAPVVVPKIDIPPPQEEPVATSMSVSAPIVEAVIDVPAPVKQTVPFGSLPVENSPKEEAGPVVASHDDWDAMLFGNTDIASSTPVATPAISVTPAPVSVNREYHPIQTSADPRPHHDDGPLFPVLNPNGITKTADVISSANISSVAPAPITSPAISKEDNNRVVVYEPQDLLNNKPASIPEIDPQPVPPIPQKPGVINHELLTPPLPVDAPVQTPVVPSAIIRREGAVPSLRVMPGLPLVPQSSLPMKEEEHHLSIEEEHPLMKSVTLNLAFGVMIVGSSLLLLNSNFPGLGEKLSDINSTSYVAGVGSAFGVHSQEDASVTPKSAEELSLPFSDEVVIDPGSKPNSVVVRPVFKGGMGNSYEYAITPISPTSTATQ